MATIGRPPIGDLTSLNLRIPTRNVGALDRLVKRERVARTDPGFNRTDAVREAVAEYIERHKKADP
jgi:hypothetical protein